MDFTRLLIGEPYRKPAFIAGHIYVFRSSESVDVCEIPSQAQLDDVDESRKFTRNSTYYDPCPVCIPILHDDHHDFELVINLKVMPPEIRNKLVMPLLKRGLLEKNKDGVFETLSLANSDKPLSILSRRVAENLAGTSLEPYLNKYNRKHIVNPRHIGWEEAMKVLMIDWTKDTTVKTNTFN